MEIPLTWDLLVIIFFTVIIAYTFIIGRNHSVKIIISTYIAILAADGVSNIIERYFLGSNPAIKVFDFSTSEGSLVMLKIVIFILCIILITTRGKFNINMSHSDSVSTRIMMALSYGVLSAGLITSTMLLYASGAYLVQESSVIMNKAVLEIYQESKLIRLMIDNYSLWFSLPAVAFVITSFFGEED